MTNNNSEKRWLTWLVRIVLPALIAAMWLSQTNRFNDLGDEVAALHIEMRGELAEQAERNQAQDILLTQHEVKLAQVLHVLFGD